MSWGKKRDEWRKARDGHKIKKGAVSGVSIGDAIDKVTKAEEKGYASVIEAATALKKALDKYQTGLKKAAPTKDFSVWIDTNIMKDVDTLIANAKADLKAVTDLKDLASKSPDLKGLLPDLAIVQSADALMKKDTTLSWPDATAKLNDAVLVMNIAKHLAPVAKAFKGITFRHELDGSHKKTLNDFGKQLEEDIVFAVTWVRSKTRENFIDTLGPAKSRTWAHQDLPDVTKAFKVLTS
jgi:hypothetical protein